MLCLKKTSELYRNYVRVIGGKFAGRRINILNINGLRPTISMIRETLFNWLMPVINNSNCLDCFAGSGALGIEAISRYANSVTFIESNRLLAEKIKINLSYFKIKNATVINNNILCYLINDSKKYNIIFIDPPFYKNLVLPTIFLLEHNGWLSNNSWIYIENEKELKLTMLPKNWRLYRKKTINQIIYSIYLRCNET